MGENSAISWCQHTWNPWIGCQKVSPACDGCYAEALMDKRYGRVEWGPHGKRIRTSAANWKEPFRWDRKAAAEGTRPFVFCLSLGDIFDNRVPSSWRRDAFDVQRATPHLIYLLLTKRPQNAIAMCEEAGGLPPNAAIGTTTENQQQLNLNAPALLRAKSELNPLFVFLSCEPLLGPLDLWLYIDPLRLFRSRVDWVITGGETDQGGHKARPTQPQWLRDIRDQCARAEVPYHHKQNGEWFTSKKRSGRLLDGREHNDLPRVAA